MSNKKIKEKEINSLLGSGLKRLLKPMIGKVLPFLLSEVDRISMPIEKGGWKQPKDDAVVVLIAKQDDQVLLNVHPVRWNEKAGGMVLQKPIKSHDILAMINEGFGVQPPPRSKHEETQVIDNIKSEEE
ncbi:MAG TPA: hypothetical protein VJ953_18485 [Saprospiraceae bacterium]|nr:hypothetical protein [Saprospiraceae bacterium]